MDAQRSMIHRLLESAQRMSAVSLALQIEPGMVISKIDFQGSDLRIDFTNGKVLLVSAIECSITGKPTIQFEVSPTVDKAE